MECHESTPLLSSYLDDASQLGTQRHTLESHLSECAQCRSRLESLRALKHAIARLPGREEPPAAVRAHVEALRIGGPTLGRRRAAILAVLAAAVALTVTGTYAVRRDRAARLADDLVADHLRSVPDVRPAEIASHDRAAIIRFFAEHVPFPAVVPDLPGSELLGARLCQIEGRRVELLFYRREERTLSLFITDAPTGDENCWETRNHHVCSRSHGKTSMLLVGQLPADELRRLLAESTL